MRNEAASGQIDRASRLGNPAYMKRFDEVARALERKMKDSRLTAAYVVSLTCDLLQFMEDHLGENVAAPPLTKVGDFAHPPWFCGPFFPQF